jgi:hypothetical protein
MKECAVTVVLTPPPRSAPTTAGSMAKNTHIMHKCMLSCHGDQACMHLLMP